MSLFSYASSVDATMFCAKKSTLKIIEIKNSLPFYIIKMMAQGVYICM